MTPIEERLKARQQGTTIPKSSVTGSSIEERLKKRKASLPAPVEEEKPRWEKTSGYRDWETDRKSTRLNSSHSAKSRMPSSA